MMRLNIEQMVDFLIEKGFNLDNIDGYEVDPFIIEFLSEKTDFFDRLHDEMLIQLKKRW